ncbi:MAG: hypothetical protein FWF77_02415, partial [Defluviitaleaceae bacterium]|nr:hypothetical protein [Defluviitaleaceae bacterium]
MKKNQTGRMISVFIALTMLFSLVPAMPLFAADYRSWFASVEGSNGTLAVTSGQAVAVNTTVMLELEARAGFALTSVELATPSAPELVSPVALNLDNRTFGFVLPYDGTDATYNVVVHPVWQATGATTNYDIIIYAVGRTDAWINLTTETLHLPPGFQVAQRTVNFDAATPRWQNGAVPANFSGLLNRQLTLAVRNVRNPAADAIVTTIEFPTIQARPRANHNTTERLALWYSADTWTLRTRPARENNATNPPPLSGQIPGTTAGTTTPNENMVNRSYEVWRSTDSRGRLVPAPNTSIVWSIADLSNPEYYVARLQPPRAPGANGAWDPTGERTPRASYWFRLAPSQVGTGDAAVFTPASNAFRIRPAFLRNPLNLRPVYATETLRVRFGQEYSIDGENWFTPGESAYLAVGQNLLNPLNEARVIPWIISPQITANTPIFARTAANGRRTRSVTQVINLQPRLHINPAAADSPTTGATEHFVPGRNTETNGRWVARAFQRSVRVGEIERNVVYTVWNPARNRWVPVPRMTATGDTLAGTRALPVRLNPSARIVSRQWVGHAASETG